MVQGLPTEGSVILKTAAAADQGITSPPCLFVCLSLLESKKVKCLICVTVPDPESWVAFSAPSLCGPLPPAVRSVTQHPQPNESSSSGLGECMRF